MTYTTHGHHIPGSPEDSGDAPPKARCGGVGLCSVCSTQAGLWAQEAARRQVIDDLEAGDTKQGVLTPVEYESVPVRIKAVQFQGGMADGLDLVDWIRTYGGNATWRNAMEADPGVHDGWGEELTIETNEGWKIAYPGWWIIYGTEDEFYPIKDEVFQQKYKMVIDDSVD